MAQIGKNNLGNDGIKLLVKIQMPKIEWLWISNKYYDIGDSNIGNEGAKHLIKAKWLDLQQLWICNNIIIYRGQPNIIGWTAQYLQQSMDLSKENTYRQHQFNLNDPNHRNKLEQKYQNI